MNKNSFGEVQLNFNSTGPFKKTHSPSLSLGSTLNTFSQPKLQMRPEAPVICKRIDNTPLTIVTDNALNKPFVPLAIPIEKPKKPIASNEHSKSRNESKEKSTGNKSLPLSRNTSSLQITMHSKLSAVEGNGHLAHPHQEPKEQKNKKSKSSPKKTALASSKSTKDIKPANAIRFKEQPKSSQEKRINNAQEIRNDQRLDRGQESRNGILHEKSVERTSKHRKSQEKLFKQKPEPKVQNFFNEERPLQQRPKTSTTSLHKANGKVSSKHQVERHSAVPERTQRLDRKTASGQERHTVHHQERSTEKSKGSQDRLKSSSRSPFRVGANESTSRVLNRDRSSEKKKPEKPVPPEFTEKVRENAQRYLHELRQKKEVKHYQRRLLEERKMALEEGNRRIREANFKRFNIVPKRKKPTYAWGVDQRKFQRPGTTSHEHSHSPEKKKLFQDDIERRKRLGLENLDEETIRKRSTHKSGLMEQSQESLNHKPKRQLGPEERQKLLEFMARKRMEIERQKEMKKHEKIEQQEIKRAKLEYLEEEAREARIQAIKNKKKSKKKLKPSKGLEQVWSTSKEPMKDSETNEPFISMKESDDENYNRLYDEYRKIIRSKQGHKQVYLGKGHQEQPTSPDSQQEFERYRNQLEQQAMLEERKEDVKKKFFEISNRYQKTLINNIQAIESSLNRSSRVVADNSPDHRNSHNQPIIEEIEPESDQRGSSYRVKEARRVYYEQERTSEEPSSQAQHQGEEYGEEYPEGEYPEGEYPEDEYPEGEYPEGEYPEGEYPEGYEFPEESYREILEAAAIFIQKNWRGYRTRKLLREYFQQLCEEDLEFDENGYGEEEEVEQNGHEEYEEYSGGREAHVEDEYEHEMEQGNRQRYTAGSKENQSTHNYEVPVFDGGLVSITDREADSAREGMKKLREFWEDPHEEEDHFLASEEKNNLMKLVQKQRMLQNTEVEQYEEGQFEEREPERYREEYEEGEEEFGEGEDEYGADQYYFPSGEGEDPLLHEEDGIFVEGFPRFRKARSDGELYEERVEDFEGDDFEADGRFPHDEEEEDEIERQVDENIKRELHNIDRKVFEEEYNEEEDGLHLESEEWGPEGGRGRYEQEPFEEGNSDYDSTQNQLQRIVDVMGDQEKMVVISTIHSDDEADNLIQSQEAFQIPSNKGTVIEEEEKKPERKSEYESRQSYNASERDEYRSSRPNKSDRTQSTGKVDSANRKGTSPQGSDQSKSRNQISEFREDTESQETSKKYHKPSKSTSDHRESLTEELSQQSPGVRKEDQSKKAYTPEQTGSHQEPMSQASGSPQGRVNSSAQTNLVDKELLQKTLQLNQYYQQEINRLREEQLKRWNEVINQLNLLKNTSEGELGEQAKAFIEHLQKQSESNKRKLQENTELHDMVKSISLISDERAKANEMELLLQKFNAVSPTNEKAIELPEPKNISPIKSDRDVLSPSDLARRKKPHTGKRPYLQIDVNVANEEEDIDGQKSASSLNRQNSLNLDLSQMRLIFGSEQLLREQSARTQSQGDTPSGKKDTANSVELDSIDLQGTENLEVLSIFERDPFKEFTRKKLQELAHHENMKKLIEMREKALEARHNTQMEHMKKMLDNKRFSPRTFQHKKIELERWVTKEKEQIQKSKRDIERGWLSTAEAIKRTQRDLQFLQKIVGQYGDKNNASDLSLRNSYDEGDNVLSSRRVLFKSEGDEPENETKSERVPRMPFLNLGSELRSPTATKNNIKIIDKFELKDHLLSPKLSTPKTNKDALEEFKKEVDKDFKDFGDKQGFVDKKPEEPLLSPVQSKDEGAQEFAEESMGSAFKESQNLENKLRNLGLDSKDIEELERGAREGEADLPSGVKISGRTISPIKQPSPEMRRGLSQEDDIDAELDQGENIEWEEEACPGTPEAKTQGEKLVSPKREKPQAMDLFDALAGGNLSPLQSPKSPVEVRPGALLRNYDVAADENKTPEQRDAVMIVDEKNTPQTSESSPGQEVPESAEKVTEEIIDTLINEVEEEFSGEKKHIGNKLKEMEGGQKHYNLTSLIENNHVFNTSEKFRPDLIAQPEEDANKQVSPTKKAEEQEEAQQIVQQDMFKSLGIKTDIEAVANYLNILLNEIRGPYKEEFLRNINTPIGPTASEKLSNMHAYDTMGSESSLEMSTGAQQAILSIELYLTIEQRLMEENKEKNEISVELEHIHNKMIFDSLNEVLDSFRPYGLAGQQYPWKPNVKGANPRPVTEKTFESVLEKAKTRVLEWAQYMCGYYGDKDEFIQDKTNSFVEEYLAQVKEDRLSKMLAAEVHELEDKWIVYDDEEAEVQLELADLIFDKLVSETTELIIKISEDRHKGKAPVESKALAALAMFERRVPGERKKSL